MRFGDLWGYSEKGEKTIMILMVGEAEGFLPCLPELLKKINGVSHTYGEDKMRNKWQSVLNKYKKHGTKQETTYNTRR